MDVDPFLMNRECYVINLAVMKRQLEADLHQYWGSNGGFRSILEHHGSQEWVTMAGTAPKIVDDIITTLIKELFTETQTDLRNAGQLVMTEQALMQRARLDNRRAHEFAEELFSHFVNYIGGHIPHMTFGSHDGFEFEIKGLDLIVYRK